jgi:glycine betaine transporter
MLFEALKQSLHFFGPFYLYLGFGVVVFMLTLLFLPISKNTIADQKPDSSWFSWVAMLFSTGMGPGLLLRAVQEPGYYFIHPPKTSIYSPEILSFAYTFFHWGLTPWPFLWTFWFNNRLEKNGFRLLYFILF